MPLALPLRYLELVKDYNYENLYRYCFTKKMYNILDFNVLVLEFLVITFL